MLMLMLFPQTKSLPSCVRHPPNNFRTQSSIERTQRQSIYSRTDFLILHVCILLVLISSHLIQSIITTTTTTTTTTSLSYLDQCAFVDRLLSSVPVSVLELVKRERGEKE
jgi:hypothetical protein